MRHGHFAYHSIPAARRLLDAHAAAVLHEVPLEERETTSALVREVMENVAVLRVPGLGGAGPQAKAEPLPAGQTVDLPTAYFMTAVQLDDGSLARVDTFRPDPAVPPDWYRVQAFDFSLSCSYQKPELCCQRPIAQPRARTRTCRGCSHSSWWCWW